MERNNGTRISTPASTNQPPHPTELPRVVNDASSLNLTGRSEGTSRLSPATSRPPIRRADADKSKGGMALLTTKEKIGIGTWNVRTLYQKGNLEIPLNQMENFDWEVIGISKTHWTESG